MIKAILDEIANESSTNQKMVILAKYKGDDLLKKVLYLANSKRVKFYIKQIPTYMSFSDDTVSVGILTLEEAIEKLKVLSSRQLTGGDASDHLKSILSNLHTRNAYVIERIIEKDLKINMGSNINKVFPKLIEETPYMGAKPFDAISAKALFVEGKLTSGKYCYADVKMDGRYNNAIVEDGEVKNESRQGETVILSYLKEAKFIEELRLFPNCVFNGELTIDGIDRLRANGVIMSLIDFTKKRDSRTAAENAFKVAAFEQEHNCTIQEMMDRIIYTVWDVITIEQYAEGKCDVPYYKRKNWLKTMLDIRKPSMIKEIVTKKVYTYEEALVIFQEQLNKGLEGIILKAGDGLWVDGKPKWQIKMKLEMTIDLKIVGFSYGTKGTKNEFVISSILCESEDGLLKATPGGMDEKTMRKVTDNQDSLLGTIVEVECAGISQDSNGNYSLLHPRIGKNQFRDDKTIADTLAQIKANENMCKGVK